MGSHVFDRYHLHKLDNQNRLCERREIAAQSDHLALVTACGFAASGQAIEIWCGSRMVGRVPGSLGRAQTGVPYSGRPGQQPVAEAGGKAA